MPPAHLPALRLQACHSPVSVQSYMVGIAQLAEHRIVVPGVVGSSPITHPIPWLRAGASAPALASFLTLGCSQVVRHGTLTPAFVGSSPTIPATSVQAAYHSSCRKTISYDPVAQLVEQRPFKAKVRGSSPRRVTKKQHWIFPMLFLIACQGESPAFFCSAGLLSVRAESRQRHAKEGDFDFPLFGNTP